MVKILNVGTVQAAKGELATGTIRGIELSCGTWVDIPIILVNGMEDGPTLLVTSTEHGDEIQGIEVIRQITRHRVDPKTLRGCIIAIPVANPLAFMHHLYTSWIDNLDVSEGGCGDPGGRPHDWILSQCDLGGTLHESGSRYVDQFPL